VSDDRSPQHPLTFPMDIRRKEQPLLPASPGSAPDLSLTTSGAGNVAPVLSAADKRRWRRARQKEREAVERVETLALATSPVVSDDKQTKTGGVELDIKFSSLSVSDTRKSRGGSQPGAGAKKKATTAVREEAAKTGGVELDNEFSSLSVSDIRRPRGGSQPGAGAKKKATTAVREEAAIAAKEAKKALKAEQKQITTSDACTVAPVLSDADKRRWRRARQKEREAVETLALATSPVVIDDKQTKTGGVELDIAFSSLSVSDTRRSRGGSQPGAGAKKKATTAVREQAASAAKEAKKALKAKQKEKAASKRDMAALEVCTQ